MSIFQNPPSLDLLTVYIWDRTRDTGRQIGEYEYATRLGLLMHTVQVICDNPGEILVLLLGRFRSCTIVGDPRYVVHRPRELTITVVDRSGASQEVVPSGQYTVIECDTLAVVSFEEFVGRH